MADRGSSRRDFLRRLVQQVPSIPGAQRLAADARAEAPPQPLAPIPAVDATPERLARAFAVPSAQRDVAERLARSGHLELLADGRFCQPRDFALRAARAPLAPATAAWLSRTLARRPLDETRDQELLAAARAEARDRGQGQQEMSRESGDGSQE